MGGDKAMAELDGTALLLHPLRALAAVTDAQAVVAKRDTRLPALPPGVEVWLEPDTPRHPLTGVLHALRAAAGRPVLWRQRERGPLAEGANSGLRSDVAEPVAEVEAP